MCHNLAGDDEFEMRSSLDPFSKQRLSCFAQTLQLVKTDRLKESRILCGTLSKASRVSTLLHRSTRFRKGWISQLFEFR